MSKFNLGDTVYTKPKLFGTGLCYEGVIVEIVKKDIYGVQFANKYFILYSNSLFTSDEYATYVLNLFKKRDGKSRKSKTKRRKSKTKRRKRKSRK